MKMQSTPGPWRAEVLALGAVFFWSTVATAFKWTLRWIDPLDMLLVASWTSLLIYGVAMIRQRLWMVFLNLPGRDRWFLFLLGSLNPTLYYIVLFNAYHRLPAQIAQPLNYTWPMVLSLLAIPLLRQRFRLLDFIGLLLGFFGVWLVSSQGNPGRLEVSDPLGVTLAVGSSVLWATYWLLNVRIPAPEIVKLFGNFLFGAPFITLLWLGHHPHPMPFKGFVGGIYVGIFEMGWTFLLWMKALRRATATARVANLVYLSPVVSLFFIWGILKEPIYWTTPMGLALILAGIWVQRRGRPTP